MSNIETSRTESNPSISRFPNLLGNAYDSYINKYNPIRILELRNLIPDKVFDFLIEADIQRTFTFFPPIPGEFSPNSLEFYKKKC